MRERLVPILLCFFASLVGAAAGVGVGFVYAMHYAEQRIQEMAPVGVRHFGPLLKEQPLHVERVQ